MPSKRTKLIGGSKYFRLPMVQARRKLGPLQKTQVKRIIGNQLEQRYHNVYLDQTESSIGTLTELSTISTSLRDGTEVNLKSVRLNMSIYPLSNGDYFNRVRVILFRWRMSSSPTAAALLDGYSSSATGSQRNVITPLNFQNREKYTILHDRVYTVGIGTASNVTNMPKVIKILKYGKRVGAKKIHLNATGSYSDVGGVYVFVCSDSAPASTHPGVRFESQLVFTDG